MVNAVIRTTIIGFLLFCGEIKGYTVPVETKDQTTSRPNTLSDDADDLQRQLDNEARDRLKFGRPKTVWIFHFPTEYPTNTNPYGLTPISTNIIRKERRDYGEYHDGESPHVKNIDILVKQSSPEWKYLEQMKWFKKYPDCAGEFQTPVDLPVTGLVKAHGQRPLIFCNYDELPTSLTMFFDGNRLIMHGEWPKGKRPLIYGGAAHSRRYVFHCLTMHWPSEHSVGGLYYPLELQMLHVSADYSSVEDAIKGSAMDHMAFLGVSNIFKYDKYTHTPLKILLKAGIEARSCNVSMKPICLSEISPPFHEYVGYHGSMPVPPCTESVLWIVRSRALPVKREFLEAVNLAMKLEGEPKQFLSRAIQKLNDRKVYIFGV